MAHNNRQRGAPSQRSPTTLFPPLSLFLPTPPRPPFLPSLLSLLPEARPSFSQCPICHHPPQGPGFNFRSSRSFGYTNHTTTFHQSSHPSSRSHTFIITSSSNGGIYNNTNTNTNTTIVLDSHSGQSSQKTAIVRDDGGEHVVSFDGRVIMSTTGTEGGRRRMCTCGHQGKRVTEVSEEEEEEGKSKRAGEENKDGEGVEEGEKEKKGQEEEKGRSESERKAKGKGKRKEKHVRFAS